MIIVNFVNGIGNQMFQYCLYRSLKYKKKEVKMYFSKSEDFKKNNSRYQKGYELNKVFGIEIDMATELDVYRLGDTKSNILNKIKRKLFGLKKTHFRERCFNYDETIFKLDNIFLEGYWQSEKYFYDIKDLIREDFKFKLNLNDKNQEISERIRETNSISIHIRRGDYINNKKNFKLHGCVCNLNYYRNVINLIQKEINCPTFFVFSDDIEEAKKIAINEKTFYVDWNFLGNDFIDMYLMSLCKHNIIANSTFSWWGAWLNSNKSKIVISPNKWFGDESINTTDLIPSSWRIVEVE